MFTIFSLSWSEITAYDSIVLVLFILAILLTIVFCLILLSLQIKKLYYICDDNYKLTFAKYKNNKNNSKEENIQRKENINYKESREEQKVKPIEKNQEHENRQINDFMVPDITKLNEIKYYKNKTIKDYQLSDINPYDIEAIENTYLEHNDRAHNNLVFIDDLDYEEDNDDKYKEINENVEEYEVIEEDEKEAIKIQAESKNPVYLQDFELLDGNTFHIEPPSYVTQNDNEDRKVERKDSSQYRNQESAVKVRNNRTNNNRHIYSRPINSINKKNSSIINKPTLPVQYLLQKQKEQLVQISNNNKLNNATAKYPNIYPKNINVNNSNTTNNKFNSTTTQYPNVYPKNINVNNSNTKYFKTRLYEAKAYKNIERPKLDRTPYVKKNQ